MHIVGCLVLNTVSSVYRFQTKGIFASTEVLGEIIAFLQLTKLYYCLQNDAAIALDVVMILASVAELVFSTWAVVISCDARYSCFNHDVSYYLGLTLIITQNHMKCSSCHVAYHSGTRLLPCSFFPSLMT